MNCAGQSISRGAPDITYTTRVRVGFKICIKLSQVTVKTCIMLQKINISNKFGSFLFMKDAANQHIRM